MTPRQIVPLAFVSITTLTAGYMSVRDNYWPKAIGSNPALVVPGYVNSICTVTMMALAIVLLASAGRRCLGVLSGKVPTAELAGDGSRF